MANIQKNIKVQKVPKEYILENFLEQVSDSAEDYLKPKETSMFDGFGDKLKAGAKKFFGGPSSKSHFASFGSKLAKLKG